MKEYIEIAKIFVDSLNKEKPIQGDYKYSFSGNPKAFFEYWYFDLRIISKTTQKNESSNFGGAPGFVISKESKKAKIIAWWEKNELEEKEIMRRELKEILIKIKHEDWNAVQIKKLTGIKSQEALHIKNKYKLFDFSKEENILIVIKELEKFKNKTD